VRLDDVTVAADRVRLRWSFLDPEVLPTDPQPHTRRIRGELVVAMAPGPPARLAREWWAAAQLAAGRRYTSQIDADWEPGIPVVPKTWSAAEAWEALVGYLGSHGAEVRIGGDEIRVRRGDDETIYRIDPDEWAAYLAKPELADDPDTPDSATPVAFQIVPAATPLVEGLPQWAADELDEAAGAWGPVVGLVDGELVGLEG
jgi:hypothetical protein